MRWYIVTLGLSIEVRKEKGCKARTEAHQRRPAPRCGACRWPGPTGPPAHRGGPARPRSLLVPSLTAAHSGPSTGSVRAAAADGQALAPRRLRPATWSGWPGRSGRGPPPGRASVRRRSHGPRALASASGAVGTDTSDRRRQLLWQPIARLQRRSSGLRRYSRRQLVLANFDGALCVEAVGLAMGAVALAAARPRASRAGSAQDLVQARSRQSVVARCPVVLPLVLSLIGKQKL